MLLHVDYLDWVPRKKWTQRRSGPGKKVKILAGGIILAVGKDPADQGARGDTCWEMLKDLGQ